MPSYVACVLFATGKEAQKVRGWTNCGVPSYAPPAEVPLEVR